MKDLLSFKDRTKLGGLAVRRTLPDFALLGAVIGEFCALRLTNMPSSEEIPINPVLGVLAVGVLTIGALVGAAAAHEHVKPKVDAWCDRQEKIILFNHLGPKHQSLSL